jgi:four helix bundle protein
MTGIRRFEDLIAWQKARELAKKIWEMSRQVKISRDFDLVAQIRRAVVSVMSNIAEGFEREGQREFRQYLSIAKGSCAELRSQLYVALDSGYLGGGDFTNLLNRAEEVARIIGGLRISIRRNQHSSPR